MNLRNSNGVKSLKTTRTGRKQKTVDLLGSASSGTMYFSWMLNAGIYPNLKGFSGYELGKTVFLAREEAEKKLKEMKNDKT